MLTQLLSFPYLRFLLRERIFSKGLCRRTVMIFVHPPFDRGFGHLPISPTGSHLFERAVFLSHYFKGEIMQPGEPQSFAKIMHHFAKIIPY